jgi:hypothetical protein
MGFWNALTEGQGSVVAACITIFGAGLGALFVHIFLGGQLRSLDKTISDTQKKISDLANIIDLINTQVSANLTVSSEIRAREVAQEEIAETTPQVSAVGAPSPVLGSDQDSREKFKRAWQRIAARIEEMAGSHADGRTRAKYARIPRYDWRDLVIVMLSDRSPDSLGTRLREAAELWETNKRRMSEVSESSARAMERLADIIDQL